MTDDTTVSVVVPTRDRPGRLAGAVASVLAQTHRALEVVVVDDASDQPVEPLLRARFADEPRLRVVRNDRPGGAAASRNRGLAETGSPVVAFLDDDDRWHPAKVERQLAALAGDDGAGLVSCHHRDVVEGARAAPAVYRGPRRYSAAHLEWANLVGSFSFVMARRDLLGEELVLDERFPSAEDWDLWLRCARRARPVVVDDVLVDRVVHGGPRLSDPVRERAGLQAFLDKHGPDLSPACRGFLDSHVRMETGEGWAKRRAVLAALVGGPPTASAVLVTEQVARLAGALRHDPGFPSRALVRLVDRLGGHRGPTRRPLRRADTAPA